MKQVRKTTLLHQAASKGCAKEVKQLLESGVEVNIQDEKGNTPLKLACQGEGIFGEASQYEKPEIVKMLLEAGANPNIVDEDDDSPLSVAGSWSNDKSFETIAFLLLEAGADIHKINNKKQNALHLSAPRSEKLSLEFVKRGMNVNTADFCGELPIKWAILNSENENLISVLLDKMDDIKSIEQLILENVNKISSRIMFVWYSYQAKQNKLREMELLASIKTNPNETDTWTKICGWLDFCIKSNQLGKALDFDKKLTAQQIQIGHQHKHYPIYRVSSYILNGDETILNKVLLESIIYADPYRYNENWREHWKYISGKEVELLHNKVNKIIEEISNKHEPYNYYNYKTYPIEVRPFIWLEKTTLNKAKESCALTGNKLTKGNIVYKFRNLTEFGKFNCDFFYADATSFEANFQAMENKRKFECNAYEISDFRFYWKKEWFSIVRSFWFNIDSFNLEKTLKLLSHPISSPSSFTHCYGRFIEGQTRIKREHEHPYNKGSLVETRCCEYLNIWHALIKCGYIDQIIECLPKLPNYIPYLLLCFDIPEVREKTEAYLKIEGIADIFRLALKSYSRKNEQDLQKIISFSLTNPEVLKDIAKLLSIYEIHLYNIYNPTIDWYCQAFAQFSTAKGAGLLDLFIPNPHLLKPLSLFLKHGGILTEANYYDSEIFFIRTIILYTTLFNGVDIQRLFKSLSNDSDGNVYFDGVEKKVYDKTFNINKKLVEMDWSNIKKIKL